MWILESSGDFLQGRRMWLKPGQKYLFGRVKKDGVRFAIDHKTVSRKHFVIEVDNVKQEDVAKVHARTKITIVDQNSKSGTSVNGEVIKDQSRELKGKENSIRPGTCPHELVVKWEPCVLTFNLLKKEIKSGLLKTKQDRVRELDIKAVTEFITDFTTHIVANKRNTPKGLQALINGKYMVADSFVDAIQYAATPTNLDEEEDLSPLEIDFDDAWPKAEDHLPPPGREPTIRPVKFYQPNSDRKDIFHGYTFVFCDQTQYDNLLPVVTSGHGKALFLNLKKDETTVDDVIRFMHNVTNEKGVNEASGQPRSGTAIMVRWNPKTDSDTWVEELINHVALKLDQRAIDQAEFLDAILANDASVLQQTIPYESTVEGRLAPPPSAATSFVTAHPPSPVPSDFVSVLDPNQIAKASPERPGSADEVSNVRSPKVGHESHVRLHSQASSMQEDENNFKRSPISARYLGPQISRFKNFDDGFDADSVVPYDYDDEQEVDTVDEIALSQNGTKDQKVGGVIKPTNIKESPTSLSLKRKAGLPSHSEETSENDIDDLMPAAAALKRQKLDLVAEAKRRGIAFDRVSKNSTLPTKTKLRKITKEIDVREAVRAQREAQDEAIRKDQEAFRDELNVDNDNKGPTNLAVIEVMNLPMREQRAQGTNPEDDPRWDPKWNGRKNFKKFRPQNKSSDESFDRRHSSKVIVPLVEVKRNTGGLGEKYWSRTPDERQRGKTRESQRRKGTSTQGQSVTQDQADMSQTINGTGPEAEIDIEDGVEGEEVDNSVTIEPNLETRKLQLETAEILHHEIDLNAPRTTRTADRNQSQSVRKRPSNSPMVNVSKRQKTLPVTVIHGSQSQDEGDEDSDDLKFRFGSRARRGKAKS